MYEHYREAGDDDALEVLDAAWKQARLQSWELRQQADDEWVAGNALHLWTVWTDVHRRALRSQSDATNDAPWACSLTDSVTLLHRD